MLTDYGRHECVGFSTDSVYDDVWECAKRPHMVHNSLGYWFLLRADGSVEYV